MNRAPTIILLLIFGVLSVGPSCGTKAPPFIPKEEFTARVEDLRGEAVNGEVLLKGNTPGLGGLKRAKGVVRGARVYYGRYPLENPPCDGCPIAYQGFHPFGPEVISEQGFSCKVPVRSKGEIYYFKVHLVGKSGGIGPPSNRVKIIVK